MSELFEVVADIDTFLLILVRISAYVFISPVFGRSSIPSMFKVLFSVLISFFVFQGYGQSISLDGYNDVAFVLVCAKEAIIGMLLGFTTSIFFSVFYIAGQIIDMQLGFQLGSMFDAQANSRIPDSGNFLYAFAFLTFLALDGHLKLIYILYRMYESIPVMSGAILPELTSIILNGFYGAFLLAVKMVIPVTVIMLLCQLVLGIMVKFVPQMNVFIIGIPIKILVGLFILVFMITPLSEVFEVLFDQMFEMGQQLIGVMT